MNLRSTGIAAIAAFALTTMAATDADAARLGGGRSFGAQRPSVAPRASTPPATTPPGAASQPVMPAQPGATLPAKPATAAPSGASRWLGPIAGLAAGLGLAALLSHFGLSEGFGSFLLLALLVVGGIFVVRMLLARRSAPVQRPLAYAGSQSPAAAPRTFEMPPAPQWDGASRVEPVLAPSVPATAKPLPAGFDADGFLRHAKLQFVRLQAAHDIRDRTALSDVMTPEMYAEVARDLDGSNAGPPTEVVTLQADLLEVETEGNRHWASVRFTGTMREGAGGPINTFDEIWNLTKPADGSSGWLLAGIQQPA
jgi:predicted lipid-binding transport protein (Tim44 family)